MRSKTLAVLASILILGSAGIPHSEESSLSIPQSVRAQHDQIISTLARYAKYEDPVGSAAKKALAILNAHYARDEAFVLPPLAVLPRIAKGEVSNMQSVLAMARRTRAAEAELLQDHVKITSSMNELLEAGAKAHDDEVVELAAQIAVQSLAHIEIFMPATLLIGDYLRQKLSKEQRPLRE